MSDDAKRGPARVWVCEAEASGWLAFCEEDEQAEGFIEYIRADLTPPARGVELTDRVRHVLMTVLACAKSWLPPLSRHGIPERKEQELRADIACLRALLAEHGKDGGGDAT